jgi:hypothetical protein
MKLGMNDSVGENHHFHAIHSQRAARAFRSFHPWRLGFVSTAVQLTDTAAEMPFGMMPALRWFHILNK